MELLERITSDPGVMGGQPCIRHLRITVSMVLDSLADGMSEREIIAELPVLEHEDITAALHFAASRVREDLVSISGPQGSPA